MNFEPFVAEEHKQEATGFELLPVGQYEFAITRTEMKPTSKGGQALNLQCTVQSGGYQSRIVFVSLNLVAPPNPTEGQLKSAKFAKGALSSIVTAVGLAALTTSYDQLIGIPFMGTVGVDLGKPKDEKNPQGERYPDRNKITSYKPKGTAAPVAVAQGPWGAK